MTRGILILCLAISAFGAPIHRNRTAVEHFKHEHPCPVAKRGSKACPGYVVDHIYPLCAGGEDDPENMQWQPAKEAKRKDVWERFICGREKVCPKINTYCEVPQ